ncbi:MAG: MerR family transcriptional regulator [Chloroflexi bacterium]|nr:MerR family transcriptional regulator [Chloroflexota bacterium]
MPLEPEYSIQELATIAGITPRTVRYYVSVGLLPAPEQAGPNTRYGEDVLRRIRLIRRLQDQHLPLAEIRSRLESLSDADISAALDTGPRASERSTALDYIRFLSAPAARTSTPTAALAPSLPPLALGAAPPPDPSPTTRSTWERVALSPDIELHIRRPLGRLDNKRVDRLIAIAREILQEDPS